MSSFSVEKELKSKLEFLLSEKNKTIRKTFKISLTDVQDNPRKVFEEIMEYINEHRDKIDDYEIESYIDDTFSPIIIVKMIPIQDIRKSLINSFWEKLVNVDVRPYIISKKIEEIFSSFEFEFGSERTMRQLASLVETFLKSYTREDFSIQAVNANGTVFLKINHMGRDKSVDEFISFLCDNNLMINE